MLAGSSQREADLKALEVELTYVQAERNRLAQLARALRDARTQLHVGVDAGIVAAQLARERTRIAAL